MEANIQLNAWKITVPSGFYSRLKFLQSSFEEKLKEHEQVFKHWIFEGLRLLTSSPVLFIFSTDGDAFDLFRLFLPINEIKVDEYDTHSYKQICSELVHSGCPHMFIGIITVISTFRGDDVVLEIQEQSILMLYDLKNMLDEENIPEIAYVIHVIHSVENTSASFDITEMLRIISERISEIMDDNDKTLQSRIFLKEEKGIIGCCSRILEKSFAIMVSGVIQTVLKNLETSLQQHLALDNDDLTRKILFRINKNEKSISDFLQKCLQTEGRGRLDKMSEDIAGLIEKELYEAFVQEVHCLTNYSCFVSESPLLPSKLNESGLQEMIKYKILSGNSLTLSLILDSSSQAVFECCIRTFRENWNKKTEKDSKVARECTKAICDFMQQKQREITDTIPYQLQICLGRLNGIKSLSIRNNSLVIKVSPMAYTNQLHQLEAQVREVIKDWKAWSEHFKIEKFGKALTFFAMIEAGTVIGHMGKNQEFKRGVTGAIGDFAGAAKFAITCSHVAPPGQNIFTEDFIYLGTSSSDLSIEPDFDYMGAILDFTAVQLYESVNFNQAMKHPEGYASKIKVFDGVFSNLIEGDRKLYLFRGEQDSPVFVKYKGETHYDYGGDEEESPAREISPVSTGQVQPFRRIDMIEPLNSNNHIRPGDSGSTICYFDEKNLEIVLVFMVVGECDGSIACCRVVDGLRCLQDRGYHISFTFS